MVRFSGELCDVLIYYIYFCYFKSAFTLEETEVRIIFTVFEVIDHDHH